MSLVFSAVTPHPPILLPAIGKKALAKITKTKTALRRLEQELYPTRPQAIVIISPHMSLYPDAFSVNAHTEFASHYEEFGDLTTKKIWRGYPDLAAKLSHGGNVRGVPLRLVSEERLDHGASIPLLCLTEHLPEVKVLPLGFSGLSPKEHLTFGEVLKDCIMETDKRIALVASGDLSHTLTADAPAGFNPAGKKFDAALIELLESGNTVGIAGLSPKTVKAAEECGYRSILILLGVLKNMNFSFKTLAYESPFGVGYLTGQFAF